MIPPVASRFVAGESPPVAIDHARRLNEAGIGAILNLLGEHYGDRESADADAAVYRQLLADLSGTGLDACVSVKPSQVGLDVGEAVLRENLRSIAAAGATHERFVWIDMEGSATTDATLSAFVDLAREFEGGLGVCVQANLRRTPEDLARFADVPGRVRLVKGAYDEPPSIAHTDRAAVDEAYRDLLATAFRTFDDGVAVGSHDPAMIDLAIDLHETYGTPFEIQMLMGVREAEQRRLAAEGYVVRQYAPFGSRWLSYFYRRLRERRENVAFALRAIVGGRG
jgi:proline dehydrogenase